MSYTYAYADENDSPWNQNYYFDRDSTQLRYMKVDLVFDFLLLAALLGFFVWACITKQPRWQPRALPLKAIACSILGFILSDIIYIVFWFLGIFGATVKMSFVVMFMLQNIFYLFATVTVFYVFYQIIQRYLERLANGAKTFVPLALVHWVVLALLTVLAVADCAVYIADQVLVVNEDPTAYTLNRHYWKLYSARTIIFWLVSLEVLVWSIFIGVRSGAHKTRERTGVIPLVIGSLFFFILNISAAIIAIRYYLEFYISPLYLETAITVILFLCTLGVYGGLILCCSQWQGRDISPPQHVEHYQQTSYQPYPGHTSAQYISGAPRYQ